MRVEGCVFYAFFWIDRLTMSKSPLLIDTILTPQGAEYRTVSRGLGHNSLSGISCVPIPIGSVAVRNYMQGQQGAMGIGHASSSVIVMGLCGSLSAGCNVGDVVVYDACVESGSLLVAPCSSKLTDRLLEYLPDSTVRVRALTSDRVIESSVEKRTLGRATDAHVIDMEGYPIVEMLTAAGVAVAMIRVVSDGLDQDLPKLAKALDDLGGLRPLPLAVAMLRQPVAATHLIVGSLRGLQRLYEISATLAKAV